MFLKAAVLAAVPLAAAYAPSALADAKPADAQLDRGSPAFHHTIQLGVDHWILQKRPARHAEGALYRSPDGLGARHGSSSPWLNFSGQWWLGSDTAVSAQYRVDQASGSRLDELSLDVALSPSVGTRAGWLDEKLAWCRRYDTDSPWIHENDPFCSARTAARAQAGSPGLQLYTNVQLGDYRTQAVASVLRPTLAGADGHRFIHPGVEERLTVPLPRKSSVAFNAVNTRTGSEARLSWMRARGMAFTATDSAGPFPVPQDVRLFYGGAAFHIRDDVSVRATYLAAKARSGFVPPPVDASFRGFDPEATADARRESVAVELNHQLDARTQFSLGWSASRLNSISGGRQALAHQPGPLRYRGNSFSVGWRREMGRGLFAVVQFSHSTFQSVYPVSLFPSDAPAPDVHRERGGGHGLGMRVGYRF